jgi:hypothetical protein
MEIDLGVLKNLSLVILFVIGLGVLSRAKYSGHINDPLLNDGLKIIISER